MLKLIDIIENVDRFEFFNSELIINSNFKIINQDSENVLLEFKNRSKINRVSNFNVWNNRLFF